MNAPPLRTDPPPGKHGCWFYGCLTLLLVMVLAGVATFFTVRYAVNKVSALVEQYTDAEPLDLPAAEMRRSDYESLEKRLASFQQALDSGKPTEPLVLTADEINALLANSPGMSQWKGRARIGFEGDRVSGQVSLPMDALAGLPGLSRLRGRFLNGMATFEAGLTNGILVVTLQSLQVKGQPVPEEIMAALRRENLAKDAYGNPETAALLSKFDSVTIEDERVVVKARTQGTGAGP